MTTQIKEASRRLKRPTQTERIVPGRVTPRLLTEEEASIYTGIPVNTLRNLRPKTPKRWTEETLAAALRGGRIVPPPYVLVGRSIKYDIRALDPYIEWLPVMGKLPEPEDGEP